MRGDGAALLQPCVEQRAAGVKDFEGNSWQGVAMPAGTPREIVVLNAGTWQGAPVHETSEAMWDAQSR